MKSQMLFPYSWKKIGLGILIPSILLGLFFQFGGNEPEFLTIQVPSLYSEELFAAKGVWFSWVEDNIAWELIMVGIIVGGMIYVFSKEKVEDEFIAKIRLDSLLFATYVNYGLILFAILAIYGMPFLTVMAYNLFSLLIIFIIRFRVALFQYQSA